MDTVIRLYEKRCVDELERLTGVRIIATEFIKRDGQKPLFVKNFVSKQNS